MTKKNFLIVALALGLVGLSIYFNKDSFATDTIQVSHRSISPRGAATKAPANPVVFLINKKLKLTAVKVVIVSDAATNKYPHAIWNLVSDSNSIPVKEFFYGNAIRGMRLAMKGVGPEPLQPGLNYRLLIEAGSDKLEHDFVPVPRTQ